MLYEPAEIMFFQEQLQLFSARGGLAFWQFYYLATALACTFGELVMGQLHDAEEPAYGE